MTITEGLSYFPLTLLFACFASMAVTLVLCLNAHQIGEKLQILDLPNDERKRHQQATPLLGGISLLAAVLPLAVGAASLLTAANWHLTILVWANAVAALVVLGLADDTHSISARTRLIASFGVFIFAASFDPHFLVRMLQFETGDFSIGLGTGWLAVIFTSLCCVGLVNAVNMADGKNGLVIGLSIGWLAMLATRAPAQLYPPIAILAAALAVLLMFNLRGRLFLGDGGAYGIASAIGLLAILTYNSPGEHASRAVSAGELVVLFWVPVVDSFRLTFVRMRRGQSPMAPDRNHLHHHLQNALGWPRGLLVYYLLALAPAAVLWTIG